MAKSKRKKLREKIKMSKPVIRLSLPSNRRHKSKKDYKRVTKVKLDESES